MGRLPVRSCATNAPLQIPRSPSPFGASTAKKATLHGHQTFAPATRGQRSVHPAAAQPLAGSRGYRHDELSAYRNAANGERGLFP